VVKRSPILGYNHNVRYRGLVFHVQTEDSGLLSPHLFTHLFYGGVIISTRKLVYDAGAAEDAIKALMQAQHKAVLKDLKKGSFDDKIDQYLAGTPGLLPREAGGEADGEDRPSKPAVAAAAPVPQPPIIPANAVAPAPKLEPSTSRLATEADVPAFETPAPVPRTKTAERTSAPTQVRSNLPPPPPSAEELGGPTLNDREAASIAAAVVAASATLQSVSDGPTTPVEIPDETSPLEIELELDEPDDLPARNRPRDTDIASPADLDVTTPNSRPVPAKAPPAQARASSSVGAAALPPKPPPSRLPSRPQITPPQVIARPLQDRSGPVAASTRNDDAVEVYAPAPPSAEPPPGERSSAGQYAQHKRVSQKLEVVKEPPPRPGANAAGLGRPVRPSTSPSSGVPKPVGRDGVSSTAVTASTPAPRAANVPAAARDQSSGARARTPTPSRMATAPAGSQTVPSPSRTASSGSGGVVMTRPAVIVGAPAKPAQPQRVRKAREDEGRGFGQGLISEKSLDEVILAYLSEDADEK
jgi:hypothetical protein